MLSKAYNIRLLRHKKSLFHIIFIYCAYDNSAIYYDAESTMDLSLINFESVSLDQPALGKKMF